VEWPRGTPNRPAFNEKLIPECYLSVYKSIRVMNDLHNAAFGSLFFPVWKLCGVLAFPISAYCTIKLGTSMGSALFGFFHLYFIAILVIIVPGAMLMSEIYKLSSEFHRNVQQAVIKRLGKENLVIFQQLRAVPELKCKIGEFYYMEGKAKLTLADNLTRGVSFMLLSFN